MLTNVILFVHASYSVTSNSVTLWIVAHQAPLFMSLPFRSPGDLPNPGIELISPVLAGWFFNNSATWETCSFYSESVIYLNRHRETFFCLLIFVQTVVIVIVALVCSLFDVFWCKSLPSPERDHVLVSGGWIQIPILLLTSSINLGGVVAFMCFRHLFVKYLVNTSCALGAVFEAGVITGNKSKHSVGELIVQFKREI